MVIHWIHEKIDSLPFTVGLPRVALQRAGIWEASNSEEDELRKRRATSGVASSLRVIFPPSVARSDSCVVLTLPTSVQSDGGLLEV